MPYCVLLEPIESFPVSRVPMSYAYILDVVYLLSSYDLKSVYTFAPTSTRRWHGNDGALRDRNWSGFFLLHSH